MNANWLKNTTRMAKEAARLFGRNDPLRMAASTAFFSMFALPPILFILIHLLGYLITAKVISNELFRELQQLFGTQTARQIGLVFTNFERAGDAIAFPVVGLVFVLFVSTTLFVVIRSSINDLWNIKQKSGNSRKLLLIGLKSRAVSLGIILCAGILVLLATLSDVALLFLGKYLDELVPQFDRWLIYAANHLVSLLILTIWFAILFKYLPDVQIQWKAAWVGAGVTAVLLEIGKEILEKLLVNSGISSIYGAAGSIVLFLLFIFYYALILFYGASFTRVYIRHTHGTFKPRSYAASYQGRQVIEPEASNANS